MATLAFFMACTALILRKEIKTYITATLPGIQQNENVLNTESTPNTQNSQSTQNLVVQDPAEEAVKLGASGDLRDAVLYLDELDAGSQTDATRTLREQFFDEYKNDAVLKAQGMIKSYDYVGAAGLLAPVAELQKGVDAGLEKLFQPASSLVQSKRTKAKLSIFSFIR